MIISASNTVRLRNPFCGGLRYVASSGLWHSENSNVEMSPQTVVEPRPLLKIEGLTKTFPGVTALENVCLEMNHGEILALVGENGAGKSTLIKILTGVYQKDHGRICIEGSEANPRSPSAAFELGIGVIHQEFNLVPEMSAAENVFLGRQPRRQGLWGRLSGH